MYRTEVLHVLMQFTDLPVLISVIAIVTYHIMNRMIQTSRVSHHFIFKETAPKNYKSRVTMINPFSTIGRTLPMKRVEATMLYSFQTIRTITFLAILFKSVPQYNQRLSVWPTFKDIKNLVTAWQVDGGPT